MFFQSLLPYVGQFLAYGFCSLLIFFVGARWYRAKLQQVYGMDFLVQLEQNRKKSDPLVL